MITIIVILSLSAVSVFACLITVQRRALKKQMSEAMDFQLKLKRYVAQVIRRCSVELDAEIDRKLYEQHILFNRGIDKDLIVETVNGLLDVPSIEELIDNPDKREIDDWLPELNRLFKETICNRKV